MMAVVDSLKTDDLDFGDIYRTQYRRVFHLCRYLLNSQDKAEDAAHEVFLRAHAKRESYDRALPLSSWLLKITSNYCIDLLRRRKTEQRIFDLDPGDSWDAPSAGASPLSEVLASERGKDVRAALGDIPEKYRVPLVLAYYNELGYDEIAGILGVERTQVAVLIFRGKQHLRQRLGKENKRDVSQ
jgi:RNA polymerase sigma-70 factor, ECF subfamily